ncbi:AAA family ATPase [Oceanibium sediminis]|uniref:AAA family ATPase n=1 Tax=Oceanibium sediminis TaxID=2026339 RepID=UPI000DD3644C|nr:AAA family ATPase [Oceanibium sediminis]
MHTAGLSIGQTLDASPAGVLLRGQLGGTPVLVRRPGAGAQGLRAMAMCQSALDLAALAGGATLPAQRLVDTPDGAALALEDDGGTLLSALIPAEGFRLDRLLELSLAIARATEGLHRVAILHCDIRPGTLILSEDGATVRFVALDSALRLQPGVQAQAESAPILSHAAPERSGRIESGIDERADLYSLGVTLYQMACGALPFTQADPAALAHAHIALPAPDLALARPDLPRPFADIVHRLLAKDPDERYATAHGLAHDLQLCLDSYNRTGTVRPFPLGQRDVTSLFRLSDRIYGRDAELSRIMALYDGGPPEGRRAFATVAGPSGIGKTAFVNRLRLPLARNGGRFHTGKFDQFRRDQPYLALIEVARSLMRRELAQDAATLEQRRQQVQEAVGDYGALLTELIPELGRMLGPQPPVEAIPPADAARRFNALILRYLRCFASIDAPLVIFVDDLQWADPASLSLLEMMGTTAGLEPVFFILGYRSNEVGPGHPALHTIAAMEKAADETARLTLRPLATSDLRALVADTLYRSDADSTGLADHIARVSAGNAFFAREFLTALHERGHLTFSPEAGHWEFDLANIREQGVPDSVAVFLTERLDTLPAGTLDLLDTASCVGSEFDLGSLSSVHGLPGAATARGMVPAVESGIVVPLGGEHAVFAALDRLGAGPTGGAEQGLANARYRFRHDQVRLVVHDRLDDARRAERHLQVGRLLLQELDAEALSARVVEVFTHIAEGAPLVIDPAERRRYAELGLRAGRKARQGLAFQTARDLLDVAQSLLPDTPWATARPTITGLLLTRAECAFAVGDIEELERLSDEALTHVREPEHIAAIQGLRIRYLATENRNDDAADIVVAVSNTLGVPLPRKPHKGHVLAAVASALAVQGRRAPEDFADLPETDDNQIRAAIRFATQTSGTAYFAEPNLLPLIGITATRLSLKHGLSPASPYGFAVWALVLCGVLGMIDRGYAFGQLALTTGKRYGGGDEARARFVFNTFIRHWKEPLEAAVGPLLQDWAQNRDAGDEEDATYCAGVLLYTDLFSGRALDMDQRYAEVVDYLRDCNMEHVKHTFLSWVELIRALRRPVLDEVLSGPLYDHPSKMAEALERNHGVQITQTALSSGILHHYAGRLEAAEENFALSAKYEENAVAQVLVPALAFYRALNAFQLAATLQRPRARKLRRIARAQMRRVATWAKYCPANMAHRLDLLRAEQALAAGDTGRAILALTRATEAATARAPLYQAMAQARLGDVLEQAGNPSEAANSRIRAAQLFDAWGAPALANRQLDRTGGMGRLAPVQDSAAATGSAALDLRNFISSIGAVATEIDRDALIERLLGAVLQGANADRGVLILMDEASRPVVEVEARTDTPPEPLAIPLDDFTALARPAVDLCLRTGDTIVINVALSDQLLDGDAHVRGTGARAILCVPLSVQGRTTGAIYLENSVASHAFTEGRVEIAEAFCTQAGISLENARLYARVQDALDAQTRQTEANRRFVPEALLSNLGYESITDVSLNEAVETPMSVVFADLRSFTRISGGIGPKRTIEMINRYLSHVQPGIAANKGFVGNYMGDGLLALFPVSAEMALFGALSMIKGLEGYNRERADLPELRFGIGVETGPVILGMVGDTDHMQCGVLGDAVNTASRIEGLTKLYRTPLLLSRTTVDALGAPDRFDLRPLGPAHVAGRKAPVDLFECLDALPEAQRANRLATLPVFKAALDALQDGALGEAAEGFRAAAAAAGGDPVADALAARAETAMADPVAAGRAAE